MLHTYGHSYSRAVMHLFPELNWDLTKFSRRSRSIVLIFSPHSNFFLENYWQVEANRKDFFLEFAKEKGFDPNNSAAWYKVRSGDVLAAKVPFLISAQIIIHFYLFCLWRLPNNRGRMRYCNIMVVILLRLLQPYFLILT